MPPHAGRDGFDLIGKAATQRDRQEALEHFKGYFCEASGSSHSWSSSASWAETDLRTYARAAARNAPLFIEAFYDACRTFAGDDPDAWAPDVDMLNELLARHGVGYVVRPPTTGTKRTREHHDQSRSTPTNAS